MCKLATVLNPRTWFGASSPQRPQSPPVSSPEYPSWGAQGLRLPKADAEQLLTGEMRWLLQDRATQIRGSVVLIELETDNAVGKINLVDVLGPLEDEKDLIDAPQLPLAERKKIGAAGRLPYKHTYVLVCMKPQRYANPIDCSASKPGKWTSLGDMVDLPGMHYAGSPQPAPQPA